MALTVNDRDMTSDQAPTLPAPPPAGSTSGR